MNMKKLSIAVGATALLMLGVQSAQAGKGNGLPTVSMKGSFLLNVHAVDKCPSNGFDGSNRNTIVVKGLTEDDFASAVNSHKNNLPDLSDLNDINLMPSDSADSFQVLDGNACDDDPALFAMPPLVATTYDVFLKLVGKPGASVNPVLCARNLYIDEDSSYEYYCNVGTVRVRDSGQSKYVDVTDELLWLLSEDWEPVAVFDDAAESYFWDFSATTGAKAQIRFVPKS